jgi:hypothetical protein
MASLLAGIPRISGPRGVIFHFVRAERNENSIEAIPLQPSSEIVELLNSRPRWPTDASLNLTPFDQP